MLFKTRLSKPLVLYAELLRVHPKSYTLFMAVNSYKANSPELDDLQNTNLSKLYIVSKNANVILIVMRPPKTQS